MNKLQFSENKVLKLTNVLKCKLEITDDNFDFNVAVEQMKSYINAKGAVQVGPLIQFSRTYVNEEDEIDVEIMLMLQCNNYIHNVSKPYFMESIVRVPNSLYCRFIGPESKLKLAYDKINIEAFERDITLDECNYTVFVAQTDDGDKLTADVFVPRK